MELKGVFTEMKKIFSLILALMLMLCGGAVAELPQWVREDPGAIGDSLVVYTTLDEAQQQTVEKIWYQYYPDCTIEWMSDSIGKLIDMARVEADHPSADVILGGLFESDGDIYHDLLQQYTSNIANQLTVLDPYGYYTYMDIQYTALVVNKDLEAELGFEITGYADLLRPELKGKIILADPTTSSSAYCQLQTILLLMGETFGDEKAWEYVDGLMANCDGRITTAASNVFKSVISGECVVGLSYENMIEMQITKNGADNIRLVYPAEGNTACACGAAMIKSAPHYEAAAAFIDFVASAEYHQARLEESCARGTNGTIGYGNYPSDEALATVDIDWEWLSTQKAELMEKWQTHWEASIAG